MKLDKVRKNHYEKAAEIIDEDGISASSIHNDHWIVINDKEYPFKAATKLALQQTGETIEESEFFRTAPTYLKYARSLGFKINFYKEHLNFFTEEELYYFSNVSGSKYNSKKPTDIRKGVFLRPLVAKTNKWAEISLIEDFTYKKDSAWQWNGDKIKDYLWIRLYRKGASKKVFFILGVSGEENDGYLYFMIECLRRESADGRLSKAAQHRFDKHITNSEYKEKRIYVSELKNYDWDRLTQTTTDYINEYSALYDELVEIVNDDSPVSTTAPASILFVDPPRTTKSYVKRERKFKEYDTDWTKKHSTSKKLGNAGEEYVEAYERERLTKQNRIDLAEQVHRKKDGAGYDILSFDENGREKYIEVKSTLRNIDEPFYFSINERAFLTQHKNQYVLYRLHNIQLSPFRAHCYELTGKKLLAKAKFNPTSFEVCI